MGDIFIDQFNSEGLYEHPDPKKIYKHGTHNASECKGFTILHKWILCVHRYPELYEKIVELIEKDKIMLNQPNDKGWTPLILACRHSKIYNLCGIIKELIKNGADINFNKSWTPLGISSTLDERKSLDAVKIMVDAKADVNLKDANGLAPLMVAFNKASPQSADCAKILIDAKADVNIQQPKCLWTPLLEMLNNSNPDLEASRCIKILIDAKADVNLKNNDGLSPLMLALKKSHTKDDILKILLDAKADVNVRCPNGDTPLKYALDHNNNKHAKLLIDAKADVDTVFSKKNRSLLMDYVYCEKYSDAVDLLLAEKASVNYKDEKGHTPLIMASTYSNDEGSTKSVKIVEKLLNAKANINTRSKNGSSALGFAIRQCHSTSSPETVEFLLKRGADPNLDSEKILPLYHALNHEPTDSFKLLINYRATIDASIVSESVRCNHSAHTELLLNNWSELGDDKYRELLGSTQSDSVKRLLLETKNRTTEVTYQKKANRRIIKKYVPLRAQQLLHRYGGMRFRLLLIRFRLRCAVGSVLDLDLDSLHSLRDHFSIGNQEQLAIRLQEL